jgi:hypothetical protein
MFDDQVERDELTDQEAERFLAQFQELVKNNGQKD